MLEVVAGFIKENGKVLICQRPENKSKPLMWEFPGGKVEKGESRSEAIKRELEEELGIEVETLGQIAETTLKGGENIHLMLIECRIKGGKITLREHNDAKWVKTGDLHGYRFCEADVKLIGKLAEMSG